MKRKAKSIRKTMWGVYWKLHDKRRRLVVRFKGYLDGLPPETCRRIALGMFAVFAVLAPYTFGRAVYGAGRGNGLRMETGYAGRMKLLAPVETDNHSTPYLYGTDKE